MSESNYIKLENGLNMHYQRSGHGDLTLLFIPGWTMTTSVFEKQLDYFRSHSEFTFIAIDPRSHGKTTQTSEGNHYEQHGRDIQEFIQALELQHLVICGWSFGTLAMLSYINQSGLEKLRGLIMLDGPPRATGGDNQSDWVTYCHDDRDSSQAFYTMGKLRHPDATNRAFAQWMLEEPDPIAEQWIVDMTQQTPNSVASLLNAAANFLDYREDLIRVGNTVPVWCVVRAQQQQIVTTWCNQNLPTAQISAFGEHMMFWEQSERFNQELCRFLNALVDEHTLFPSRESVDQTTP